MLVDFFYNPILSLFLQSKYRPFQSKLFRGTWAPVPFEGQGGLTSTGSSSCPEEGGRVGTGSGPLP